MAFRIPSLGGEAGSEDTFPRIYLLVDSTSQKALENLSPTGDLQTVWVQDEHGS